MIPADSLDAALKQSGASSRGFVLPRGAAVLPRLVDASSRVVSA
jgi:hypothetical protein